MALTISRFETTERIRQIYFLQLIHRIKNSEELCDLQADFGSIEALYPGFLNSQNFVGVSVNKLFEFITYETRGGVGSIYNMKMGEYSHFPDYLYGFCVSVASVENIQLDKFPLLYDRFEESAENDLVAMFLFRSLFMYYKKGVYLNVSKHPNLYDEGFVRVSFLDGSYFAIEDEDENNGTDVQLFSYKNGRLAQTEASSIELLQLMDSKSIYWGFNNLTENLRDDKKAVLLAFSKLKTTNFSRNDLSWVSARLRDDYDVAKVAVSSYFSNYAWLSDRLKLDETLSLNFVTEFPAEFSAIPDLYKLNREFIIKAITVNSRAIDFIAPSFQKDSEIVLLAAKSYPGAYAYYLSLAPPDFFHNKSNIIDIVTKYPMAISHLSDELKNDIEIAGRAIRKNAAAAEFIPALKTDRNFAFQMIAINGSVIRYLETFGKDESLALECVKQNGLNLQFFPDTIRNNKHIVLEAHKQNKDAIFFATDALKKDKEIGELLMQQKTNNPEEDDLPF